MLTPAARNPRARERGEARPRIPPASSHWRLTRELVALAALTACAEDQPTGPKHDTPRPALSAAVNSTVEIVFSSERDGNREIYVMNADGSGQTRLTNNPALDGAPASSPDGTRLAFWTERDGNDEIYFMNPDGSGQTNFTNHPEFDSDPGWSPDGTKLAFQRGCVINGSVCGNHEVFVVNLDGSGLTNLSNNDAFDDDPAWSPDGTRLAFRTNRHGGENFEVYVMNADGSGQTNFTNHPALDTDPDWSPDGTKIAFSSNRDGNFEIYVMNAVDGSNPSRLTDTPGSERSPAWSPDGTKLAFSSNRDGNFEIYVMNADGSGQTNLTNNPANEFEVDWRLAVAQAQTITFNPNPLPDRTYGSSPFTVSATSSSGLRVSFEAAGTCTIAGAEVTLTSAGSCTVTAAQAGNPQYAPADPVDRPFQIAQAVPAINWADPAAITVGTPLSGTQLNATATGVGGAALAGTFAYTPAAGTILGPSPGQALEVTFTPLDPNYTRATTTVHVAVLYPFAGFFQPVDNRPMVNRTNAGQAIPVKFSLGGDRGLDIFLVPPTSVGYVCSATPEDAIEQTEAAVASSLTYDAVTDQYKYVWKTEKPWGKSCRKLVLKLKDGTSREALFHFTK